MKLNVDAVEKALAQRCMTFADLRPGVSPLTVRKLREGQSIRPDAAGRIARRLGVSIEQIMERGAADAEH